MASVCSVEYGGVTLLWSPWADWPYFDDITKCVGQVDSFSLEFHLSYSSQWSSHQQIDTVSQNGVVRPEPFLLEFAPLVRTHKIVAHIVLVFVNQKCLKCPRCAGGWVNQKFLHIRTHPAHWIHIASLTFCPEKIFTGQCCERSLFGSDTKKCDSQWKGNLNNQVGNKQFEILTRLSKHFQVLWIPWLTFSHLEEQQSTWGEMILDKKVEFQSFRKIFWHWKDLCLGPCKEMWQPVKKRLPHVFLAK